MKKIIINILVILSILMLLQSFIISTISNADVTKNNIKQFNPQVTTGGNNVKNIIGSILNIIRIIGAAVAICMLLVVATKYIIASAGERADIKKYAINYVIGALIFLSASAILTLIKNFINESME